MLALLFGLSVMRIQTSIELLHLGLQPQAEGGPHIARFVSLCEPYKRKQDAPSAPDRPDGRPLLWALGGRVIQPLP